MIKDQDLTLQTAKTTEACSVFIAKVADKGVNTEIEFCVGSLTRRFSVSLPLMSSQHQSCGGGVQQAGGVRGKDSQPPEKDPVRRHGQLPDQAGQRPPGLPVPTPDPAGSRSAGVPQHFHRLLPLLLPDAGPAVGLPLRPAQLLGPGLKKKKIKTTALFRGSRSKQCERFLSLPIFRTLPRPISEHPAAACLPP